MINKLLSSGLALSAVAVLVGCGGGNAPEEILEDTTGSKISGVATDDLIFNGVVSATAADGTALAEGRTSATDGTYTLNVAHEGVVLLNVTCDENSTMGTTPATAQACGNDVSLHSMAEVEEGVDQTVNLSPLTEVVYQRAVATAGGDAADIDAEDFDNAREEIGLMFGVDPIADDPTQGGAAAVIGAIHTIAGESGSSVMDVTDELAAALSDGSADGEDSVQELAQAMDDVNLSNNLTDNNGTYTQPEDPAQLSDVESAKALFTELRTQAMSVTDYQNSGTPGFLDTEAQSMNDALNDVVLDLDVMGEHLNYIANDISYMVDNNLTEYGMYTQTSPGNWTYSAVDENGTEKWSGTISIPAVLLGDDAEAQLYTSGTLTMTVNGTLPISMYEPFKEEGLEDSQSFEGTISVTKTTTGADISISGKVASNGTSIELKEADAEVAYHEGEVDTVDNIGNTEPVFDYFKLNNVVLQGIVGGYTIDGSVTVNSYAQNTLLAPKGGMYETYDSGFNINFVCNSQINVGNIQFTYNGITYEPVYSYIYTDGAYFDFDNINAEIAYENIMQNLSYNITCADGESLQVGVDYNWNYSDSNIANSGWLPNDVTFEGSIAKTNSGSINGSVNAKWKDAATFNPDVDEDYVPMVAVEITGKLQMPERPEMLTTITFENNASNNSFGASYTYGTTVINADAVFDTEMNNGDVAITTHTGLRADIKVTDGDIVYGGTSNVTKDGALVGEFEERENVPVIKYIDGSFESLP